MVDTTLVQPANPVADFAMKNMWSSPYDNQQFRLGIKRVSPEEGYVQNFHYINANRALPIADTFYQVYTLSGVSQAYWNLIMNTIKKSPIDVWLNVGDLCSKRGVHVDLYNDQGMQFPRRAAWLMRTYDGLNLLAIEKLKVMPLSVADNFYLRCYTPDWDMYHSDTGVGDTNAAFQYKHYVEPTSTELTDLNTTYNTWSKLGGLVSVYFNGIKWDRLPYSSEITDDCVVEIFFDPTVFKTYTYNVNQLPDFYSSLDAKRKFILHPPKDDSDLGFYSFDDCDFYFGDGQGKSLYLALNDISVVRQLTHRDYSVSEQALDLLVPTLTSLAGSKNGNITVIYRSTKLRYDLQYEANKIRYLYRLDDAGIVAAMTSVKSTLPEWTADGLEKSNTMQLDRALWSGITRVSTYNALGYNAATKVFADTPNIMPYDGNPSNYDIPLVYQGSSTALEYDSNGLFLGYTKITKQSIYSPVYVGCKYVEFLFGQPATDWNYVDSQSTVTLPDNVGYRVFLCGYSSDNKTFDGKWTDITGSSDYTVADGVLTLNIDPETQYARVIFDDTLLLTHYSLNHIDKSMYFNFTDENIFNTDGEFAPANLLLILNGYSLIENVDYVINYPECYIFNRSYVKDSGNDLLVVGFGLTPSFGKVFNQSELGYIAGGSLGYNSRFNIREDRRTRVVVGGRIWSVDELGSAEQNSVLDPTSSLNGLPYGVQHIYQALPGISQDGNYVDFDAARDLDSRASDYLTKYVTKQDPGLLNIQDRYRLYSPFMHLVVYAIKLGVLTVPDPLVEGRYSKQVLTDLTSAYQWILNYDPIILNFDLRYFSIAPYANPSLVTLTTKQLLFISQLNDLFLQSKCQIIGYFEVSNNV